MKFITSHAQLREIYGDPWPDALRKQLPAIDKHSRAILEKSPFVLIGSQDCAGRADVTPRGDKPGFAKVLDDQTLAIPDRPGNKRLDTWHNIIENPSVGLLFLVPGMNETLRINGTAKLTADTKTCEQFSINERPARAVLIINVQEVFLHCAKAFIRASFWQPDTWPDRSEIPSMGEIMRDQIDLQDSVEDIDQSLAKNYRDDLW